MSNNPNRTNAPEAEGTMSKPKMGVANEVDVPSISGYNGNLTSARNGSVGGYMVKKVVESCERQLAGKQILRY